jgi:hypothetical protein
MDTLSVLPMSSHNKTSRFFCYSPACPAREVEPSPMKRRCDEKDIFDTSFYFDFSGFN